MLDISELVDKMMLKIKRVPTVVSNFQKEEGEEPRRVGGCGRNCLQACCIEGMFLSLILSIFVFPWNFD